MILAAPVCQRDHGAMPGRSANDQTSVTPDQVMVRLAFGPAVVPIRVNRNAPDPIVDQITDQLANVIRAGAPVAGSRLPSIRALARRLAISTYTVVEIYDRLAALGLTVSRAGLGVFVARHATLTVEPPAASPPPDTADAVGLVVALTGGHPTSHAPGSGFLPAAWIEDAWQGSVTGRFHRRLATNVAVATGPRGHAALREQIVARLAGQGIEFPPDRVMITQGATQALDLIMRSEFSVGDTVLVEDPGYFMLFPMLDRLSIRQIAVPRLPTGPNLEVVEQACRTHQPKAFFCSPCCIIQLAGPRLQVACTGYSASLSGTTCCSLRMMSMAIYIQIARCV
jgi:DNA-binding transcriptional MocR family regulator